MTKKSILYLNTLKSSGNQKQKSRMSNKDLEFDSNLKNIFAGLNQPKEKPSAFSIRETAKTLRAGTV